jgi:predicted naringenin-chalcone synthase
MVTARITGMGNAFPESVDQDALWTRFFSRHFEHSRIARRVFASSGVRRRHAAANPVAEDLSNWSTARRMERYMAEAVPLGRQAVRAALSDAGIQPSDVGLLVVASCTGYAAPGLDVILAADLDMPLDMQRLLIGHMGCYAALPALAAGTDFVVARGQPVVVLCLELTSLHLQPPTADPEQVVAHALFGDAAAAVVLQPAPLAGCHAPALDVLGVAALTDPTTADHMSWHVTDLGFRMRLSPRIPNALAGQVTPAVTGLLARHGLGISDVGAWAVHPGGPRILETVAHELDLPPNALDTSREVLAERGNCSSATVLLVLHALRDAGQFAVSPPRTDGGGFTVAMAFGPGMTLYAVLLRAVAWHRAGRDPA